MSEFDREYWLSELKRSGYGLFEVPVKKRDYGLCLAAVKSSPLAMRHVPVHLRDKELCLAAFENACSYGVGSKLLRYVPRHARCRDVYLAVVRTDGLALGKIPEKDRARDVCHAAVSEYGSALKYVPERHRDREMCLAAVRSDGEALKEVPDELRDLEMCAEACQNCYGIIKLVPERLRRGAKGTETFLKACERRGEVDLKNDDLARVLRAWRACAGDSPMNAGDVFARRECAPLRDMLAKLVPPCAANKGAMLKEKIRDWLRDRSYRVRDGLVFDERTAGGKFAWAAVKPEQLSSWDRAFIVE